MNLNAIKSKKAEAAEYMGEEITSVIAECGFLSNRADESLLVAESFQERVAEAIYAGLIGYFSAVSGA